MGPAFIVYSGANSDVASLIGNLQDTHRVDDILFVVYTERAIIDENEQSVEVIRLISARLATNFERGVYYGKRS